MQSLSSPFAMFRERMFPVRSTTLVLFSACAAFIFFLSSNSTTSFRTIAHNTLDNQQPSCPVILYNKQFKTGSTVLSNVLFRTSESYGCRNADCSMQVALMNGSATHVGAHGGLTMACHASEHNQQLVANLRATHGNNFIYLASVREPISWFKSAATFFYRQRGAGPLDIWTEEGFKAAIDWGLTKHAYGSFEAMLFRTLGLNRTATDLQIRDKLLMYDVIVDHANMDDGLKQLEQVTKWHLLPCTNSKRKTYRGPLYGSYRADDIKEATKRVGALYKIATSIIEDRNVRPLFAPKE